jgi:hypothetical protein
MGTHRYVVPAENKASLTDSMRMVLTTAQPLQLLWYTSNNRLYLALCSTEYLRFNNYWTVHIIMHSPITRTGVVPLERIPTASTNYQPITKSVAVAVN